MRHFKKVLGVAVGAAFCAASMQAGAQVPDTVKVGILFSLTGGNAVYGASGLAGTRMAVEEINKAGGIAGKKIQMVVSDDQTDSAKAVGEAIRQATSEKVHVVIGPLTSQLTLAVGPTYTQNKILYITSAGSSALTAKALPTHFSLAAPAEIEAPMMVDYAVDVLKAKSIAWLGDNGAIDKTMAEGVKAEAARRGVQLVAMQEYTYRGDDVTPQVLALKRANPDVLLMRPNTGEDHGLIMKTMAEMSFKPQVINGGGTAATAAPAVKAFADSYRGVVNLMYKSWTYCGSDAVGQTALGQFKTRLRAAEAANYDKLNQNFSAQAYDAVYLAKAAIEGAKSVDGEVLTKWIEQNAKSVKNIVSGSLDANASSHFLLANKEALVFAVDPDKPRADGLFRRAGC